MSRHEGQKVVSETAFQPQSATRCAVRERHAALCPWLQNEAAGMNICCLRSRAALKLFCPNSIIRSKCYELTTYSRHSQWKVNERWTHRNIFKEDEKRLLLFKNAVTSLFTLIRIYTQKMCIICSFQNILCSMRTM